MRSKKPKQIEITKLRGTALPPFIRAAHRSFEKSVPSGKGPFTAPLDLLDLTSIPQPLTQDIESIEVGYGKA